MNQTFRYDLDNLPPRQTSLENADFALAAIHEAVQDGWKIPHGAKCVSHTEIVMQAGCSSSTAFTIAWILTLARLAGKDGALLDDPLLLAKLAHKAEVSHFQAPGGTMDHVSIALGGTSLRIGPEMWQVERLGNLEAEKDGVWILADSGDTKDTFGHLRRCKNDRLALLRKLGGSWDAATSALQLNPDEVTLLQATLTNRNIEESASKLWKSANQDHEESTGEQLGKLMMLHHEALRDGLRLSTSKLEAMREAAISAGAWGFKLVGSGGGGCAVAWTSRDLVNKVNRAMLSVGARHVWTIEKPAHGAKIVS